MGGGGRERRTFVAGRRLAVLAILAIAAWLLLRPEGKEASQEKVPLGAPDIQPELSAWLADWHWEAGLEDLDRSADGLDSLQVFAAYFDESDRLKFTEDFAEGFPNIRKRMDQAAGVRLDLTLVNDIIREDGSESQKDPELTSRLLATEESRTRHIEEIAAAVEQYGFDGVELDYEKVKAGDWDKLISLIEELQKRLSELGKTLRVVLEPRAPLEKIQLPEGPTYVMMAYNLYGSHSGPGPKADDTFIAKLADRMERVPRPRHIALSAGGFDWTGVGDSRTESESTGKPVKGITERTAADLAKRNPSKPVRDPDSGVLHFEYADDEGVPHAVWYADGETLEHWAAEAREGDIQGIAIWRLGELGEDSTSRIASGLGIKEE
ncbi:glycosyl hydrolase family 18 protein [Cohnella sp. AR92]|uniref:glycosyl hydrolase family 18 protein n=1 Tax=Cohnella sp. AR92 TaxID=648716 RepID=UPI000F8F4BA4|nr:glycosyl hydrolase family 18 protein [Cohnella sp. AR92]RUS49090.1 glycosyl hydrolase [Cohnella sp. AR92]